VFPYTYTDPVVRDIIHGITNDAFRRLVFDDGPARIAQFWATDATIATGISWAQTAAAVASAVFAFILVVSVLGRRSLMKSSASSSVAVEAQGDAPAAPVGALRERFNEVVSHLDSPRESDWKVAVIEADKLVDDALRRAGYGGATFGDRLTGIAPGTLLSLDGIWWAHKIRNRLAHEMDYFLRYTEAKQAVTYYRQALEELQML
jgi:hypothetical protein